MNATAVSDVDRTPSKIRRLHHHAYPTADHEVNRVFMEEILGIPLRATWTEIGENGTGEDGLGPPMEICHTFFELADGGALAFFQMGEPFDREFLVGGTNLFDHIALETDAATQDGIEERLRSEGISYWITDHGYVKSLYVTSPDGLLVEICADPPDVEEIRAVRAADAHSELRRWLAGDHASNNYVRGRTAPFVKFEGRELFDRATYPKP